MLPDKSDSDEESNLVNKPKNKDIELLAPEVIRSEVNFLVLPFFALWDKEAKRKKRTEYKTSVTRNGKRLEISWIVSSNAEFGYPGPFDRAVHKAVEQIISDLPLPIHNPIAIGSLYSFCGRMGINKLGGSQYRKIKEALTRIVATTIISRGAFYSKEKDGWIEDVFHLYDRIVFKGEKLLNGNMADTNYLFLSSWYLDNVNANYVKPVDWTYYKSLKTPVAQRLYELLGVKFYGLLMKRGKAISYKYSTICDLLPITRQKYLSDAKKLLDPAHSKLKDTSFLEDWDWEETGIKEDNDWLIRYYPGEKAKREIKKFDLGEQLELELPSYRQKEANDNTTELPVEALNIAEQLIQRGITQITVNGLVKDYAISQIQDQIMVFDWLVENKSSLVQKNPAGFLRKSIEENYHPPKEYVGIQAKRVRDHEANSRRERWLKQREKLIKQDIIDWGKVPLEKRIEGRLGFWITGETMNGRTPTPEQMEIKKEELIDSLPKTDDEKWEYIAQNYPEVPPNDFE
jgi:hypothetical protein